MPQTRLHIQIEKQLATFKLSVRLEVETEIMVLVGPSGAGKTQTLNAIAGLMTPDAGEIRLDDATLFQRNNDGQAINLPARRRRVGYVFQHYALFPHLTALQNVAYSLWRKPGARRRALELLERMDLAPLADSYPHQLSGGQQQRVAIARAMAAGAKVLLMDEPFSALDRAIREKLHQDLCALQTESDLVVIYVTHNLDDALAVGHRLALISEGCIEQVGSPADLLRRPASPTALKILGTRNIFEARVVKSTEEGLWLDWNGLHLESLPQRVEVGEVVTAYIRPETIEPISESVVRNGNDRRNEISGKITARQFGQHHDTLHVRLPNDCEVEVYLPCLTSNGLPVLNGEDMLVSLPRHAINVLRTTAAKHQKRLTHSIGSTTTAVP